MSLENGGELALHISMVSEQKSFTNGQTADIHATTVKQNV